MMKSLMLFIGSGLVAALMGPFFPYWVIMSMIAVLAALVGGKGAVSFFSAALAMGLIWFLVPLMITWKSGSDLAEKVAQIMGLEYNFILMGATSLIGFLLGGFAALTGNRFRKLFEKDKTLY